MKAIRTELLALEVITVRFFPLKPPNRMLHSVQFSSLMYVCVLAKLSVYHCDSCRTLNLSGAKVNIHKTVNGSFHCYAPFFMWSSLS